MGNTKTEYVVLDEKRPGIELVEFRGGHGYDDEQLVVSNGLNNGLRVEILNEDADKWQTFHINDPAVAKLIAQRLIEFSERICEPPKV